jgi:hypothetical protein
MRFFGIKPAKAERQAKHQATQRWHRNAKGCKPWRIMPRNGGLQEEYGINLDHNLLPDPVAKSIACLIQRIEMLEKDLAELRHDPQPAGHSGQCRTCSAGDLCCEHESMHAEMNKNANINAAVKYSSEMRN